MYEHWNRGLVPGRMMKAVEYLEASAALDPTFAPVHSALGSALYSLSIYSVKRAANVAPTALGHARRAIALDPTDASAHAVFGYVAFNYAWDWESALVHMDRALSLAPNDSFVLNRSAFLQLGLGRLDLAFTLAERSLTADPISAYAHLLAALVLVIGGDARRGIEVAEAGCRMHAEHRDLKRMLGLAYMYAGRLDDALRVLEEAVANSNRQTMVVAHLAAARARHGDVGEANALLHELLRRRETELVHSRLIGTVLTELGRVDEAFVWFDRAVDDREWPMAMWGVDRRLEPIRGDPRWDRIRQRIGIPD
jgi:tetratricopeptide (TPR) repeat protein